LNGGDGRIRVRTELVHEHLVGSLLAASREPLGDPPPNELAEAAKELLDEHDPPTDRLAAELARLGYAGRRVERERFEPARRGMPWLQALLASGTPPIDVARELALAEPAGRPDPESRAASWRVPGPGGHVRHYLALASIDERAPDSNDRVAALERCWFLGFFLRCCEEESAGHGR
jgi:hypothetical protein